MILPLPWEMARVFRRAKCLALREWGFVICPKMNTRHKNFEEWLFAPDAQTVCDPFMGTNDRRKTTRMNNAVRWHRARAQTFDIACRRIVQ